MEENQSIFMIGEPEDLLIIITNEDRFSSFKNIKEVLPSFVGSNFIPNQQKL